MDTRLALDAIIAVLLVATIVYAVVLNRKLAALRNAKAEMEALIARFVESTERAGSGVESLKEQARHSGETLQGKLDSARGMTDELVFLIEKASSLAERLEGAIGASRARAVSDSPAARGAAARRGQSNAPGSPAGTASGAAPGPDSAAGEGGEDAVAEESELLRALQGMR